MKRRQLFAFRDEHHEKPFLDHLEDLRWMIVKMAGALGLAMILCFGFRRTIVRIVQWPLTTVDPRLIQDLQSLGVADSMTISFKLAFYAGLIFAFPFLLYFLAEFVLPGLSQKERKIVLPGVLIGFGLFLAGVCFCYFIVLPQALAFFYRDAMAMDWRPRWTVREYYSFVTQFTIAFGLSFELPVVVLMLVKLEVLNSAMLSHARPYAAVVIFIFSAIITPTHDILTLLFMGGPMLILYEICVWIARFMRR